MPTPNPTFMRFLSQALRQGSMQPDPMGPGLLEQGGTVQRGINTVDASNRQAYQQYAEDATMRGQPVAPYDQWMAQQGRTTMPVNLR